MFTPVYLFLNPLDLALIAFALLVFPLLQLVTSRRRMASPSLIRRYLRSLTILAIPLIVLAVDWIGAGRTATALGLDTPPSMRGLIGLGVAALAILALIAVTWLQPVPADAERRVTLLLRLRGPGLQPDRPDEFRLACAYALVIGCGGELLFRAFLFFVLVPLAGLIPTIVIASLADALAHGYRSRRQLLRALLSAAAFSVGYALTFSLWWLMAIRSAAGLQSAWAGYRLARAS
jgi:hypothetical protein